MSTPAPRRPLSSRLARLAVLAGAALAVATWPHPARAHGETPGVLAAATFLLLGPNVGGEYRAGQGGADGSAGLLLTWPVQLGLDRSGWSARPAAARHRFVVSPELRLGDGSEFGGRVGYRWVPRPLFLGLGLGAGQRLGMTVVPEIGYRLWELDADEGPNLYVTARADVNVLGSHTAPWAASVSVGLAFF